MKKLITLSVLVLWSVFTEVAPAAPPDLAGDWRGSLQVGTVKLRLVFKITKQANGSYTAKMDSLDQGARDLPVDTVTVKEQGFRLDLKAILGAYEGTLDASGKTATGTWKQGPNTLPLVLVKGGTPEAETKPEPLPAAELAASKLAAEKCAGTWNGTLTVGAASLRLRLNITKAASGAATGTMDSLDQSAQGIPLKGITFKGGKLRVEVPGIGGVFEGTMDDNNASCTGQWQQAGQSFPMSFKK